MLNEINRLWYSGRKHRFHFKMSIEMYLEIKRIAEMFGRSMNKTILSMLQVMQPVITTWYHQGYESSNEQEWGCGKKHFEIRMDSNLYRKFKHLHGNLNTSSIAIIIRAILERFIKLFNHGGLLWVKRVVKRFFLMKFRNVVGSDKNSEDLKKSKNKKTMKKSEKAAILVDNDMISIDKRQILPHMWSFLSPKTKFILYLNEYYQIQKIKTKK